MKPLKFRTSSEFLACVGELESERAAIESYLSEVQKLAGYCPACGSVRQFHVRGEAGGWIDLRESILCECGLNGRMRMLFDALSREIAALRPDARVLLFERITPLFDRLGARYPHIMGCEFVGPDAKPGSVHLVHGREVRHEDMGATSLPPESCDLVFHGDVLEHVPDWRAAISDNARILRRGGRLVFTAPAFQIPTHRKRAEMGPEGIHHILKPAYHGNPMSEEGSLVFTEFSVSLVDELDGFGFRDACIEFCYDAFGGIVSNNNPHDGGRMWPIYFSATRA